MNKKYVDVPRLRTVAKFSLLVIGLAMLWALLTFAYTQKVPESQAVTENVADNIDANLTVGACGGVAGSDTPVNATSCVKFGEYYFDVVGTNSLAPSGVCTALTGYGYMPQAHVGIYDPECPTDSVALLMSDVNSNSKPLKAITSGFAGDDASYTTQYTSNGTVNRLSMRIENDFTGLLTESLNGVGDTLGSVILPRRLMGSGEATGDSIYEGRVHNGAPSNPSGAKNFVVPTKLEMDTLPAAVRNYRGEWWNRSYQKVGGQNKVNALDANGQNLLVCETSGDNCSDRYVRPMMFVQSEPVVVPETLKVKIDYENERLIPDTAGTGETAFSGSDYYFTTIDGSTPVPADCESEYPTYNGWNGTATRWMASGGDLMGNGSPSTGISKFIKNDGTNTTMKMIRCISGSPFTADLAVGMAIVTIPPRPAAPIRGTDYIMADPTPTSSITASEVVLNADIGWYGTGGTSDPDTNCPPIIRCCKYRL